MADDINALKEEFKDLKDALMEYGIVANTAKKTGGSLEKGLGKLHASIKKSPFVQLTQSMKGYAEQLKLGFKLATNQNDMTPKEIKQAKEKQTMLGKLVTSMFAYTNLAKLLNKNTKNQVGLFRRLTMSLFGLISIFLLVGFAIGALAIAFQGAESPLLDYTDGIPVLDEALQGLIMAMTGEGEGGLYGAINVVTGALIIALPVMVFFGVQAGLITGLLILVAGAFNLVKNETDSTGLAIAAATAVAAVAIGTFLVLKGILAAGSLAAAKLAGGFAFTAGAILLGIGLIIGGVAGLYAFITGKVGGLLGWIIAALSSFAISFGLFVVGIVSAPYIAIVAIGILIVAVIIKYRDEIWEGIKWLGDKVWGLVEWLWGGIKFIVGLIVDLAGFLFYGFLAGLGLVLAAVTTVAATIVQVATLPFRILWEFLKNMWNSFLAAKDKGWKGILVWLTNLPVIAAVALVKAIGTAFKKVFNAVAGIYNKFAGFFKFKIPKWVPVIGGKQFKLPQIPKLAKGGIVSKPTLAMVGEDGPEAVVPLTKKNNPQGIGLGGNVTININVGGVTDRTDKRALAREIGDAIRDEMFRSGRSMGTRRGAL
jgi:hypothetical protein